MRKRKIVKRLARRIAAWDALPSAPGLHSGRVKLLGKYAFRRPGSQNPRKG